MKHSCKLLPFLIFFFGVFIFDSELKAQNNQAPSFHEKMEAAQSYWDNQIAIYGSEDSLLQINKRYKHYLRQRKYYINRIPEGKTIDDYEDWLKTFQDNPPPIYPNSPSWQEIGPNQKGYIGPVNFVTVDPSNDARMFAGGEHGGLFISQDGGENWNNAGTDFLSHSISAADAQFSPDDPENTWFFMDGNGESAHIDKNGYTGEPILLSPPVSIRKPGISGVYRTIDGGQSWVQIGNSESIYTSLKSSGMGEISKWGMKKMLILPHSEDNNLTIYIATSIGIIRTQNALDEIVIWEKVLSIEDYPNELFTDDLINETPFIERQLCGYKILWVPNSNLDEGGLIVASITKGMKTEGSWPVENQDIFFQSYLVYSETGNQGDWDEWKVPIPNSSINLDRRPYRTDINIPVRQGDVNSVYLFNKTSEINNNDFSILKWDILNHTSEIIFESKTNFSGLSFSSNGSDNPYSAIAVSPDEKTIVHALQLEVLKHNYNDVTNTWSQSFAEPVYAHLGETSRNRLHMDIEDIAFNSIGDLYIASHGGMHKSEDLSYYHFPPINRGLGVGEVEGIATSLSNPETVAVGLMHDLTQATENNNYNEDWDPSWAMFHKVGDALSPHINYSNNSIIYSNPWSGTSKPTIHTDFPNTIGNGVEFEALTTGNVLGLSHEDWIRLNYFDHNSLYTLWKDDDNFWIFRHSFNGFGGGTDSRWREVLRLRDDSETHPLVSEYILQNLNTSVSETSMSILDLFTSKTDKNILFTFVKIGGTQHLLLTNKAQFDLEEEIYKNSHDLVNETNDSWVFIDNYSNLSNDNVNNFPGSSNTPFIEDAYFGHVEDVVSDPINPNVFYVLSNSWNMNRILKYTYQGDLINDDLTQYSVANPPSFIVEEISFFINESYKSLTYISSLNILSGTPDIFIGTDIGVYHANLNDINQYLDNGTIVPESVWTKYGPNLPHADVDGLEPNFIADKLRAGTFGRGAWEIDLPCDKLDYPHVFESGEDATINNYARFRQDVVVEDGATLTLTPMAKVYFAEKCKLIIEPGGKVIVNGGLLANACGEYWEGVEVQGDASLSQSPTSNQGYLIMTNGATIQNAECGVRLAKNNLIDGFDIDWSTTGGIINTKDSYFVDNKKDVEFLNYDNTNGNGGVIRNVSRFKTTEFKTTEDYFDDSDIATSVSLYKVNGVQFDGCTFVDERTDIDREFKRDGIHGLSASFDINEYCAMYQQPYTTCNGIPTEFNNMGYGIKAFNQNNCVFNINIENSVFENCWKGAYFSDVEMVSITHNEFNIYHLPANIKGDYVGPVGLYLDHNCTLYQIQENEFFGDDAQTGISVGIVITNGHPGNELVYKNSFDELRVGLETLGQNRNIPNDPNGIKGLTIQCNDYLDNRIDNFTSSFNPFGDPVKGVFQFQGDASSGNNVDLANNQFNTAPSSDYFSSFFNSATCEGIQYTYNGNIPNHNPYHTPNSLNNFSKTPLDDGYGVSNCPSQLIVITKSQKLAQRNEAETGVEAKETELQVLVDGGNTSQLEMDVMQTNNSDAWIKYQALMSNAGYLSETVLKEVSKKEDGFTHAMIRNVLVANPHAAKSKEITKDLDERSNPLPNYMREQIKLGLSYLSPKEFLELQQSQHQKQYDYAIADVLRILNSDTLNPNPTVEIVDWLSNTNDIAWDYRLVDYYDNNGLEYLGDALLTAMEAEYNLDQDAAAKLSRFGEYRNLMKTWQQNGVYELQLSQAEVAQLISFQNEGGKAGTRARALLILNNELDYNPAVVLPDESSNKNAINFSPEIPKELSMSVSPNPSKDFFTVKYTIGKPYKKASLLLIDSRGTTIKSLPLLYDQDEILINSQSFATGVYTAILTIDGNGEMQKSIIVQ